MAQTATQRSQVMTMDEYLAYDDGTDTRYELVNGELVEMPVESQMNALIARFLLLELLKHFSMEMLAYKDTEIEVSGKRAKSRLPDLMVHSEESYASLASKTRAILLRDMPPPALVIEVVSPGQESRDRDYRHKRTEYAARGIEEYWIIDPETQHITVCLWVNGQYEDTVYAGDTPIKSTMVPAFNLSTIQILEFGQK